MKLVSENRTLLEAFAYTLLENEVLEREDIERIVGRYLDSDYEGPELGNGHAPSKLVASEDVERPGLPRPDAH